MPLIRLTLKDCAAEYDDLYIDLFVDEAGLPDQKIVSYGRWGLLKGEPWPFVLRPNGANQAKVDFGVKQTSDSRFATTNLMSKCIAKGELVTFEYDGEAVCFRITEAKVMPAGDDFSPASRNAPPTVTS